MIAIRYAAAVATVLAFGALAVPASASTVESSFDAVSAFDTSVAQDSGLSQERVLNREAEKRGRKNEAGEDRRGRHGGR